MLFDSDTFRGSVLMEIVKDMFGMIWNRLKGVYRECSVAVLLQAILAVGYVIWPFDVVPDVMPGYGFEDDMAVVFFIMKRIDHALQNYRCWSRNLSNGRS